MTGIERALTTEDPENTEAPHPTHKQQLQLLLLLTRLQFTHMNTG